MNPWRMAGDYKKREDDERARRRDTILGGMINPGELTLDPEIAREPELAGLAPPRSDAQLGGMSDEQDQLRRRARSIDQAFGYEWNPRNKTALAAMAAERQALIKSAYGKQEGAVDPSIVGSQAWKRQQDVEARTQSRAQKAEQFKSLADHRNLLYELAKTATGDRARKIESEIAKDNASIAMIGTATELKQLERDLYPEKMEVELGLKGARTREIDERIQTILPKAEALLQKYADDERHKEDRAQLEAWLAQLRAPLIDEQTKGEILDNIEKLAKATGIATEERGLLGRVAFGSTKEAAKRGVAGAGLAGLSASDTPRTPPARIPRQKVPGLKSTGALALPTTKPGKDTSPAATPAGDTTKAQTPGIAPAGSAREGGATAAERVDLERRTQAGAGKGRRTAAEIRAELAKLRAMR